MVIIARIFERKLQLALFVGFDLMIVRHLFLPSVEAPFGGDFSYFLGISKYPSSSTGWSAGFRDSSCKSRARNNSEWWKINSDLAHLPNLSKFWYIFISQIDDQAWYFFWLVCWENPGEFLLIWDLSFWYMSVGLQPKTFVGEFSWFYCCKTFLALQFRLADLTHLTVIRLPWGITIMILVAWVKFPGRTRVGWIGMVRRLVQKDSEWVGLILYKCKVLRLYGIL